MILALAVVSLGTPAWAQIEYIVINLGPGRPTAINGRGRVSGRTRFRSEDVGRPSFWRDSGSCEINEWCTAGTRVLEDLDEEKAKGNALAINNRDVVVGWARDANGGQTAALWDPFANTYGSRITFLGTLGGGWSIATGITDQSISRYPVIVGNAESADGTVHAFQMVRFGEMENIGSLGGRSRADAISPDGSYIVGAEEIPGDRYHAVMWKRDESGLSLHDLGTLGGLWSIAHDVTNEGWVVGQSDTGGPNGGPFHAFVRSPSGEMRDLGTLATPESNQYRHSAAFGTNPRGDVVGRAEAQDRSWRGFLFTEARGMVDLNDLIPPMWTVEEAVAITPEGKIVVTGRGPNSGPNEPHSFLLVPIQSACLAE